MVDQTSQFYAILTAVGAAKQANADALGIPWKITQMAVGDGNPAGLDNPALPMPDASARALLNEWRRAPLNQLKVDDKNSAVIVAEQVIPADVGGRWIRELALYDADGDMVALANCAPTYKPLLNQGSGRTQVVRMNLIVSSSSNVQLKIDPSVVLATREWVTEELARQDFKHSVMAATTSAITLSGLQTVDGMVLSAGARVLVKNQVAAKDNGLYLVAAGGAWTRCSDADTSTKVTPGLLVQVEQGAVNGDSAWQLVTDGPIALGVSALVFEMAFGRTGVAAGTYRSVTVDVCGRVVAATSPTTVAGYGLTDVYTKSQTDQMLVLKAPLASPALTGVPTAPTAAAGTNTNQLANTAFVQAAVKALIASSPAALDTLSELAAALGNDANFAATMTNALANKQPLSTALTAMSGLSTAANQMIYSTGSNQFAMTPLSAFMRTLLDDATDVVARATLGAAAVSHSHTMTDIAGLAAALNAVSGLNQGVVSQDPDLAVNQVILSNHAKTPDARYHWHITTTFYSTISNTANRSQLAIQYNNGNAVYARSCYENVWTGWTRLDGGLPTGSIVYVSGAVPPEGYLKANGALLSRVTHANLFAVIGTTYGVGDGSTTFGLPDLRAEFIRGLDDGRGIDPGRLQGSAQASQNLSHGHIATIAADGAHTHTVSGTTASGGEHTHPLPNTTDARTTGTPVNSAGGAGAPVVSTLSAGAHTHTFNGTASNGGAHTHVATIAANGGIEARPRNVALLACIKY
jgi:phage-related tail fiber protein